MLFNSISFLIFFPIVVLLYYVIPQKAKNIWLLLASYFFYGCWNPKYCLLLLASTLITFLGAIVIDRTDHKKAALITGIVINIAMLVFYKYTNYLWTIISRIIIKTGAAADVPTVDILLPVGISFFTFQALGYLIDVYRGDTKAEYNFIDYALFVSFFPQLVAGPIERSKRLLAQLHEVHGFDTDKVRDGLRIFMWGLFLKIVIADRCAMWADTVYLHYTEYSGVRLIVGTIAFCVQIYCDFMGYSTMARGSAMVLGIDLMENFRQPYFAGSIQEYWRRWHISLSTWFKDYVYIPLGGSRCSKLKKYRNVIITFGLSGMWHGAHSTFFIWGLIHGILQVTEEALSPVVSRIADKFHFRIDGPACRTLCVLKTWTLLWLAFVMFRADSFPTAMHIYSHLFDFSDGQAFASMGLMHMGMDMRDIIMLFLAIPMLVFVSIIRERYESMLAWLKEKNIVIRYVCYWIVILFITLSLDVGGQEFVYFQF